LWKILIKNMEKIFDYSNLFIENVAVGKWMDSQPPPTPLLLNPSFVPPHDNTGKY